MKQFLLSLTQIVVPVKRKFLVSILLLGFLSTYAQNSFNSGDGWGSGWGIGSAFSASAGSSLIYTATNSNGIGNRYFRFYGTGTPCGQYGPAAVSQQLQTDMQYDNTTISCGNETYAYYLDVANNTDNYVFKSATSSAAKIVIFRIQGAVRSIAAVTQSPLAANMTLCSPATVTATLDGALSIGQAVYLRYTKDGFATSTVVPLTGSGTTYTGTIPSAFNTAAANVSYYVFTSGTTTPSGADADLYTINLNNNGGSNYSYTIGGATTSIPDVNFEQALIDLNLDCAIDGKVLTSNISGVTLLNLRGKNIASLEGINDFINLKYLDCAFNSLTSLNISGLTNLLELVTNNNLISSLDVSLSPDLYFLDCERNQINSLNISGLTKLQTLIVWVNQLTSLDVSNNPDLTYLDCDENAFTTININGLTNLEYFYCSSNKLSSVYVSGSTNLIEFYCNDNLLTGIDVLGLTNLEYFSCSYNKLSSVDVSGSTNLIGFYCNDNLLQGIDVRGLINLDYFDCSVNPLSCIIVDDVAAANTANTKEILPSTDPKSYYWTKDPLDLYSYCACDLTTTWNGTSWTPTAPINGTYAAIIEGPYNNVLANISACSLTIKNGANVTIPSGYNVTLNAPIVVEAGSSFTLNNNANLVQTNKNSINEGAINVNRESSPLFRLDYTMWSSPVSGAQTLGGFSPLTSTNRFYEYNATTNLYNAVSATSTFGLAKGYLIRMPNTWGSYPGTPTSWTGTFTGSPNNGDFSFNVSNVGYTAVGNPYPSTLDIDKFIAGNTSQIDGTLWFWRKTNDASNTTSYATCTTAGCVSPNTAPYPDANFMSVGQGFIVNATSAGSLKFTNTMRVASNTNQFFKTKQIEKNRIWLNLSNDANPVNQMMVAYMSGATQDVDAAIDGRYFNDSQTALNSLISNEEFAVQGRSLPFDGTDVVPLAFKTATAGNFTIAIDHVDGLFSGNQEVFLKDNNTGTETNLKASAYTFAAAAGVDNARFSLKYQRTLGANNSVFNNDSVTIHKNKGTLYINSGSMAINNIKVFDIQGRLIAEQKNVKANTATIKDLKAMQQILIVKITSQDNKVVSKKVVN